MAFSRSLKHSSPYPCRLIQIEAASRHQPWFLSLKCYRACLHRLQSFASNVEEVGSLIALDPKIRDWVLIPIFVVMFLQGVLRQHISVLLRDEKKPSKTDQENIRTSQLLRRSARYRANCAYLSPEAHRMRKRYFITTAFAERPANENDADANNPMAAMSDPNAMTGMLKQNMSMVLPNMLLLGWVSYFFSGFVLVKLPFGLTERFKSMTQRGIGLHSLDVSYVSSMSWYFLVLFGLRGLFDLVLGDNNLDEAKVMQAQMTMGMPGMGGPAAPDVNKLFAGERTELEIAQHDWIVPGAEWRLLGKTPPVAK